MHDDDGPMRAQIDSVIVSSPNSPTNVMYMRAIDLRSERAQWFPELSRR